MDAHSRKFVAERRETKAHTSYIRNDNRVEDKDFMTLVERVFDHQPAVFDKSKTIEVLKGHTSAPSDIDKITRSILSAHFYRHCYVKPVIRVDKNGFITSVKDFIGDVLMTMPERSRNNLFFIIGDVGCGKTAFINYLISKHGKAHLVEQANAWFLRFDVDIYGDGRMISEKEFLKGIIEKTLRVFRNNKDIFVTEATWLSTLEAPLSEASISEEALRNAFADFVHDVSNKCGRYPILIIDNIDYIFHHNDRILFDQRDDTQELSAIKWVRRLVDTFLHDHSLLGSLGACIVFVMRGDSYDILKESHKIFKPDHTFTDNTHVFSLEVPDWSAVIEKRGKLLEAHIRNIHDIEKQNKFRKLIPSILADLKYQLDEGDDHPMLVDHLKEMNNYGLRDIMRFFSMYSWIEGQEIDNTANNVQRFIHQYPVGLLAFFLHGKKRFSQFSSEFPNMYLVNSKERAHEHSYWLKRLIMHFIDHMNNQDIKVDTAAVLDVFSGEKCDAYCEKLVSECLGSLAQTSYSNALSAKRSISVSGHNLQASDIFLTPRGVHLLRSICDKFIYLQLIIDDHLLPFPNAILSEFSYKHIGLDYGYIVLPVHQYGKSARRMVDVKAKQVLLFLEILDSAFVYEKHLYASTFKRLESLNVTITGVEEIRAGVLEELHNLNRRHESFINEQHWTGYAKELREKIDKPLRALYKV